MRSRAPWLRLPSSPASSRPPPSLPSRNAAPLLFPTVGQLLPCSFPTPTSPAQPCNFQIRPPPTTPLWETRRGKGPQDSVCSIWTVTNTPTPTRPGMLEWRRVWYQTDYTVLILHPSPNAPRHTPCTESPGEASAPLPPRMSPTALSYSGTTRDPRPGLWPLA